jgi:SAM-dependent methyltransferase
MGNRPREGTFLAIEEVRTKFDPSERETGGPLPVPSERLLTLAPGEFEAANAFSRLDEADDSAFYARERCAYHMDARARQTVQRVIGTLCVEAESVILDLMAGWHSHIPNTVQPAEVVGLGLGERELQQNERLDRYLLHDLNEQPELPFEDASFDVVLNTASVDYLIKPFQVFAEVARVLKPGGLFLVIFTNRLFPQKAVKIWREADETTRQLIVHEYFRSVPDFGPMKLFCSRGKPRPKDDKYAGLGIPSDPVWAIYAEKKGASPDRASRPEVPPEPDACPPSEVVRERKARVRETLCCPYCEERLGKFELPASPFCEWSNEYMYVCFNNDCPYLISGWDIMAAQGTPGFSYRLMYNPDLDRCMPTPLPSGYAERTTEGSPRG